MRKYNMKLRDATWIPFDDDIQFKLRLFPNTEAMNIEGASEYAISTGMWKVFNYCLVDWKGILDDNDQPLECNEQNKEFVFEQDEEILEWVIDTAGKMKETVIDKKKVI